MLEIFVLVAMCRYLHKTARAKGRPGWPFVLLMIFGWFAGAIGGGILGIMIGGDDGEFPIGFIVGYLVGAALACIGNAIIVNLLTPVHDPEAEEREEEEREYIERRRRQARLADEEDDRADRQHDNEDDIPERDREWRRRYGDDR